MHTFSGPVALFDGNGDGDGDGDGDKGMIMPALDVRGVDFAQQQRRMMLTPKYCEMFYVLRARDVCVLNCSLMRVCMLTR